MRKFLKKLANNILSISPVKNAEKDGESGFYGLGIAPKLLDALDKLHFVTPTPIQAQAIPAATEGKDVVGIAQTGTGKTLAFAIPMIQQLAAKSGKGLVLLPTRELAIQVEQVMRQFAPQMGMNSVFLIGGDSMDRQIRDLRRNPRILIATPGRLLDHMGQGTVKVNDVRILVLDEADRMFDMGFAPQINRVIQALPKERQTMLFSATMPEDIMKLASRHMKLPVRVEIARPGTAASNVEHELYIVGKTMKPAMLGKILEKYWGSVLLFVRTRHDAARVTEMVRRMHHSVAEIHSDRSLNQRKEALEGFKAGKYRILVATDIAARGIDVAGIELVINYDLPDEYDNYVHRIGRTGRAGHSGRAISLATPGQGGDIRAIEELARIKINISTHPDIVPEQFSAAAELFEKNQEALKGKGGKNLLTSFKMGRKKLPSKRY
ncbi:MAG TPA: DEAD/DEAH box helicase [Elusimicrobiales bacterium]|nr:DEAD/DEAH box helicase [Elusimicrobiales bacterium]